MKDLTQEQIEKINEAFDLLMCGECEDEEFSFDDRIECLWQYYAAAGFDIESEEELFEFLGI